MIDEDTEIYRSLDFFIMKLVKSYDKELDKAEPNKDRLENIQYALEHLFEALNSLECNL